MSKRTKKYYAVRSGREPGIYLTWDECKAQVEGYPKAEYKCFSDLRDAKAYMGRVKASSEAADPKLFADKLPGAAETKRKTKPEKIKRPTTEMLETSGGLKHVVIYTDGACAGNPGPGGYGVVMLHGDHRKEMSAGFRLTTNNRMEMLACIVGLRALKEPCAVSIYTDSKYVYNSMTKGWARRWKKNDWKRKDPTNPHAPPKNVPNADLWEQMLELCDHHKVKFNWVRGHAGDKENERCDYLARTAAAGFDLAIDTGYESKL